MTEPTNQAWRRSIKESYRQNIRLYSVILFILIFLVAIYYIISWSTSVDARSKLGAGDYYMVSFSDIYLEVESISKAWSDDAEMLGAHFSIFPYTKDDPKSDAFFMFQSLNKGEELTLFVIYKNEKYTIVPTTDIKIKGKGMIMVQAGNGAPLPEAFGFQDSILAFEALYPSLESSITEDYLDIQWPMDLDYWPDADWELAYTLKEP